MILYRTKCLWSYFLLVERSNNWTKYRRSTSKTVSAVGWEFLLMVINSQRLLYKLVLGYYFLILLCCFINSFGVLFADDTHKVLCIEIRSADASVRVRQIKVLGIVSGESLAHGRQYNYSTIQHRQCENETLKVFRSITFQVRRTTTIIALLILYAVYHLLCYSKSVDIFQGFRKVDTR